MSTKHVNRADWIVRLSCLIGITFFVVSNPTCVVETRQLPKVSEMPDSVQAEEPILTKRVDPLRAAFYADVTLAEGRSMSVYLEPISQRPHGGIGHLLTAADFAKGYTVGDVLTGEQVMTWFETDYAIALRAALETFPSFETFPRLVQLAILNWLWQLGASAPEKFPRATAALQARDWHTAATEWLYADARTKRWSRWRLETQHRCEQEAERLQHVAAQE